MNLEEAIQNAKEKWANDPQLKKDRDKVIATYGEVFKLENIDSLTNEKFQEFLNYKHNKHWNHLNQPGGHLVKNMDELKSALKILLDESQPLSDRIKRLRDKESEDHIDNFGRAVYTPILLVTNPQKYPVVNKPVVDALDKFGLYSKEQRDSEEEWVYVPKMQKIIQDVAIENDLDLWKIDWVWFTDKEFLNEDNKQYFLLVVGKPGSTNILENGKYGMDDAHFNSNKDKSMKEVKVGDLMVVYFSSKAIDHKQLLKRIYQVSNIDNSESDRIELSLEVWKELGNITFTKVQELIQKNQLGDVFKKIGQQPFNIAKITTDDFENVLSLDGGKLSISDSSEEETMSMSDPLRWKYHHMGNFDGKNILALGIKFVNDFDGNDVNADAKKQFMNMLKDTLGVNSSQEPIEAYGKYVTLLRIYGIGLTNEKFIASKACKYYLHNKKNVKQFILSHLLRWQYPNGTSKIDINAKEVKILPFPFTLKILIKLSKKSSNEAYLSKGEILTVVTQAKKMDEVENVVETILRNRDNGEIYNLSVDQKADWGNDLTRLFASFSGTDLIEINNDDLHKLELKPNSIMKAENLLAAHKPVIFEWNDKEEWDNYHGVN